jgi:outer membrane receptor for ferric coprogen and ferric-rhodotorulic acid
VDLNLPPTYSPSGTRQELDYEEKNLIFTINQLLGDSLALGARYQLSKADLETSFPDIPSSVTGASQARNDATVHQLTLSGLFNHRSGFFARTEGLWHRQVNHGYQPSLPGASFWQLNLFAGYRFFQRRAQVQIGLLNLTDQDYRLNPLNLYAELPRERTFAASFQFHF